MRGKRRILRAICCLLVLALWPALGAGAEADGQYIRITDGDVEVVFALNDSAAAQALYAQLPLTLPVEDYGGNEKIFYPPEELDVQDAPLAEGPAGTLAYYAPGATWPYSSAPARRRRDCTRWAKPSPARNLRRR